MVTSSKEVGVTDFNESIDHVAASNSNSDCIAASVIASISPSEKIGVEIAALPTTNSTSESILKQFLV